MRKASLSPACQFASSSLKLLDGSWGNQPSDLRPPRNDCKQDRRARSQCQPIETKDKSLVIALSFLSPAAGYQRNSFASWPNFPIDFALADNRASRSCTWVTRRHLFPASFIRASALSIHGMSFFACLERGAARVTATLENSKVCRRELPAAPSGSFRVLED